MIITRITELVGAIISIRDEKKIKKIIKSRKLKKLNCEKNSSKWIRI
jgi:hypothetical protein